MTDDCGAQMPGCIASCVLPADHVQHRDSDGDRWPVDRTAEPGWIEVPRGYEHLVYDPRYLYALTVAKGTHGLLVVSGDTVRVLDDDARVDLLDGLTTVESAVLAGRLRAWADRLMERDLIPRTTP